MGYIRRWGKMKEYTFTAIKPETGDKVTFKVSAYDKDHAWMKVTAYYDEYTGHKLIAEQ